MTRPHPLLAAAILGAAALALLAAHAALIPIGNWQADEFFQAAYARDYGLDYLRARIFGGSPRPVSELLLYGYFAIVNRLHRPLIGWFLTLTWLAFLGSAFVSLRRSGPGLPWRLLLGLVLLAGFLLGHETTELFFWPAGAAAYLLTLAAVTAAFFLHVDRRREGWASGAEAAALVFAAACSETGAMFVMALSGLRGLEAAMRRPGFRPAAVLAWAVPAAVAFYALLTIALNRVGQSDLGPASATTTHLGPSLLSAASQFAAELLGQDVYRTAPRDMMLGVAVKLAFFLGCRWCWRAMDGAAEAPRGLVAFGLASLATGYGTIVGAYYQFGQVCCERHGSLRQCLVLLALAAFAIASAGRRRPAPWLVPLPFMLAIGLQLPARLPALAHDYRLYAANAQARIATWQSGLRADATGMQFQTAPEGKVVHPMQLPPGHYERTPDPPWYILGMLLLFHKQTLDLLPAKAAGP